MNLLFRRFDVDRNGKIDNDEWNEFLKLSDGEIDKIAFEIVQSGMRKWQLEAASRGGGGGNPDGGDKIKAVFDGMDLNSDGKISESDLNAVLKSHKILVSSEELRRLLKRFDASGNGSVRLKDFRRWVDAKHDDHTRLEKRVREACETLRKWCYSCVSEARLKKEDGQTAAANAAFQKFIKVSSLAFFPSLAFRPSFPGPPVLPSFLLPSFLPSFLGLLCILSPTFLP
jgi:Ca2+-binding EF-hand superfamily protein